MKFIKRILFILILLLIAFFVYRLISPASAQALLTDLKTFSNDTLGTHFSLSGASLAATGSVLEVTGFIIDDTGSLGIITGDDELILSDVELPQEESGAVVTGVVSSGDLTSPSVIPPVSPPVSPSVTKTTTTRTTPSSSSQEQRDYQNIMQGFGN